MKDKSPVPPRIEKAVITDRLIGMSTIDIGRKYGLHRVTVSRISCRFRREAELSELSNPGQDPTDVVAGGQDQSRALLL